MKIIYSKNGEPVAGLDGAYRNPYYFVRVEAADEVVLVGYYPEIAAAYRESGQEAVQFVPDETSGDKPKSGRPKKSDGQ